MKLLRTLIVGLSMLTVAACAAPSPAQPPTNYVMLNKLDAAPFNLSTPPTFPSGKWGLYNYGTHAYIRLGSGTPIALDVPSDLSGYVTATAPFGADNRVLISKGTGRDSEASSVQIDGSGNISAASINVVTDVIGSGLEIDGGGTFSDNLNVGGDLQVDGDINSSGDLNLTKSVTATDGNFSGVVGGTRFLSTIATGTAPFGVNSTTKVTNLNADAVDGVSVPTIAQGDLLFGSGSATLSALGKATSGFQFLANTGTSNNPAWTAQLPATAIDANSFAEGEDDISLFLTYFEDVLYTSTPAQVRGALNVGETSDVAYNATSWDSNLDTPTKNAIRDKIEALPAPPVAATSAAVVGTARTNGVATTFKRSDAADPIDVAMSPSWTGIHSFTNRTNIAGIRNAIRFTDTNTTLNNDTDNYIVANPDGALGITVTVEEEHRGHGQTFRIKNVGSTSSVEVYDDGNLLATLLPGISCTIIYESVAPQWYVFN